jgi:LemA protein
LEIAFLIIVIAIVLFVITAVLWGIGKYNSFIALKNQVTNFWRAIDVQLKRRHDLIPNLVNTVKGYMEFEQDTLRQVIEARNTAVSAKGVANVAAKEGELTAVLGKLFALMENYPNLKANENVMQLQSELTNTENILSTSRQSYNDMATTYNIAQQVFPASIIAGMFKFTPAELYQITNAQERETSTVNLSLRK